MPLFVINKYIFLSILSQSVNEKFKSIPHFDKKIRHKKLYWVYRKLRSIFAGPDIPKRIKEGSM